MSFKVGRCATGSAVEGTVAIDEDQVLEMRFLLERLDRAQGRFVPLDEGRFVALTRQLQAQLQPLAAVSDPDRAGRVCTRSAAPALDDVLEEAGEVEADAAWREHVARIRAAEGWTPKLPATCRPSCATTRSRASPGWRGWRAGALAPAWPTTWAWARRCRRSR